MEIPKLGTHTKKAVKEYIRSIANGSKLCEPLPGNHYAYLMELFPRHSLWTQKLGIGVAWIEVREVREYGQRTTRCFYIVRQDGTETDISWVECVDPSSHTKKVSAVFRRLVTSQVHKFRINQCDENKCFVSPIDGNTYHCDEGHVDHYPLSFEHLMASFLIENKRSVEDIKLMDHQDNSVTDEFEDGELEELWQEYHRRHAVLRLITINQHKAVTKRKTT